MSKKDWRELQRLRELEKYYKSRVATWIEIDIGRSRKHRVKCSNCKKINRNQTDHQDKYCPNCGYEII